MVPTYDHATGVDTAVVHLEGVFGILATADYELALFLTETVTTGEIIEDVLNEIRWPANRRTIDRGQRRIHPAHYTALLSPRSLVQAIGIMRGAEKAEASGLLHEGRGSHVTFEDAFKRELDPRDPVMTFGADPLTTRPINQVVPNDSWRNVYTVVRAGTERALVQTENTVYVFRKGIIEDNPLRIEAITAVNLTCSVREHVEYRFRDNVHQVVSWSPIRGQDYAFVDGDGEPVFNVSVAIVKQNRFARWLRFRNNNNFPVYLVKLELRGRGVASYKDLEIPDIEDEEAVALYRRRYLTLPASFVGDGLNYDGDPIEEGRDYAQMLLARYSRPKASAPLRFVPTPEQLVGLQISDPVRVNSGVGLPPDIYYIEGMEFDWDSDRGYWIMGVYLSRRGEKRLLKNVAKNITASGDTWTAIDPAFNIEANRYYIIAAEAFGKATGDEAVLRLRENNKVIKSWKAEDITDAPYELAGIIKPASNATVTMEARRGVQVSRYKISRVES